MLFGCGFITERGEYRALHELTISSLGLAWVRMVCLSGTEHTEEGALPKRRTKFVHEGQYAAAVEVNLIETEAGWSPYLTCEDSQKLDEVREAMRRGDLKRASELGRVYQLIPVVV